jgi:hypothetical protein
VFSSSFDVDDERSSSLLALGGRNPRPVLMRTKKSRTTPFSLFFTLEFARTRIYKTWVRKEKAPGLSVNERTNPTLCAEGTR